MQRIAIIDYGMGNLHSVARAVSHCAPKDQIDVTDRADVIAAADRIVFPGQGAAAECMSALRRHELVDVIAEVSRSKPFLGICMGMQVLLHHSAENNGVDCLDWIEGEVRPFAQFINDPQLKIPHMGWNGVNQQRSHPLWSGIDDGSRFYFVHSYFVDCARAEDRLGTTEYGVDFTSALGRDNLFAVQCHPEKSADNGLQLLKNFVRWDGQA
ncbi:imidazole glycerol phosphate synthase, glutamine amidotransferase subunit [gamma proteobacterium HTCC5015]|nr:imidazole glycerol phosphate synthase, glutamine amidotransferase subunit [gamma proteobacterium HTCC5015]